MNEMFRYVNGYDNDYLIGNNGSVYSNITNKILKPFASSTGHLSIKLRVKHGVYKHHKIHRLVGNAFIDNPENKPVIHHIDSNPLNNNVNNLMWATHSENTKRAWQDGLCESILEGVKRTHRKLTGCQVRLIRKLKGVITARELGKIFNVYHSVIVNAWNSNSYKEVL